MQEDVERTASESISVSDAIAAWLSAIIESSHDAIISKTLDGVITSWNRAAEEMFGYSAAEAIGRPITLIIPSERIAEEDYVLGQIRSGEKVDHFETIRQTKDGRRLNISLTISPIKDSRGRVIGASKIARDITGQKALEKEREELLAREQSAREQLAEAVKARDEFIAVAAHELRNPLNVFQLNLQLLHRISGNPNGFDKMRGLIEKSKDQLGRVSALVERLLDVTRIRAGTFELYRERFNLGPLVKEVANRFKGEYSPTSISVEEVQAQIEGRWDRLRIDQAITNLISNAVKYGMGQPITVRAGLADGQAVLSVCDQGIGIPPGALERIFDRFERAARSSSNDGLGLGLWITRQIVQAHGGTIRAQSEPGRGSIFEMRLPLQD